MENQQLPTLPTGEELEERDINAFLPEDEWENATVEDDLLDVTREYPIRYSLEINGTKFAPLGGLHGMTGQPGHGKTMTLSMLAAAVLGDDTHGMRWILEREIPYPSVLYIDTEMEKGNTMLVYKRIATMAGWQIGERNDRLRIMCLREVTSAQERWRKVIKAVDLWRPTVVILDGLIDVVADFNDNANCQELIFKCMALASRYQISMWTLLHENPGSEKMVGHAGSFLERKASDVMVTRKVKDEITGEVKFELKNKKVRGKDWQSYLFRIDDTIADFGLPVLIDDNIIEAQEDDKFDVYSMTYEMLAPMQTLITSRDGIATRDIREAVKQMFKIGQGKADKALSKAVEMGILLRAENKRYYLPTLTAENDDPPF